VIVSFDALAATIDEVEVMVTDEAVSICTICWLGAIMASWHGWLLLVEF
jgi:hypothetical protein